MKYPKLVILAALALVASGCELLIAEQLQVRGAGWGGENQTVAERGQNKEALCK